MGKKSRRPRTASSSALPAEPMVSVCTPTFNRRPFIPSLIRCFEEQTYDKSLMEWIVLDDGTDSVQDLFEGVPGVRYFRVESKMTLGAKRNELHSKCRGDIILYMDDDDYYPPSRVSHAVSALKSNPQALCAGSSELYTYLPHRDETWVFGPYGEKHCTAASMAFRRPLLTRTSYDGEAALAEEKHFLKNYTIPFVQLDPLKTIVVVAHAHNTFDKRELLKDGPNQFVRRDQMASHSLFQPEWAHSFYTRDVHLALADYPLGAPSEKPDVAKQYSEMKAKREALETGSKGSAPRTGLAIEENGKRRELTTDEVLHTLHEQGQAIEALKARVQARDALIANLRCRLEKNGLDDAGSSIEQTQ